MGLELGSCEEHTKEGLAWGTVGVGWVDAATSLQLSSSGHHGPNRLEGWFGESLGFLSSILLEAEGPQTRRGLGGGVHYSPPCQAEERKGVEVLP